MIGIPSIFFCQIFLPRDHNLDIQLLDSDVIRKRTPLSQQPSCGRQKGPSMMTRYARSYSLQKGPSLEDSVE